MTSVTTHPAQNGPPTMSSTASTATRVRILPPVGEPPLGALLVVPGHDGNLTDYGRFAQRIAADGYVVDVLDAVPTGAHELSGLLAEIEREELAVVGPRVLVGVGSGAAVVVDAVRQGLVSPAAVVVAGAVVGGVADASRAWGSSVASSAPSGTLEGPWYVGIPALALHGHDDEVSPLHDIVRALSWWPDAELLVVRDGGHDVLNDTAHRTVAASVVQFLERVRSGNPHRSIVVRVPLGNSFEADGTGI